MNCPNCKQTLEAGAQFCGNCGQPIATQTTESAVAGASNHTSTPNHGSQSPHSRTSTHNVFAAGVQNAASLPASPMPIGSPGMATMNHGVASPISQQSIPVVNHNSGLAIASLLLGVLAIPGALIPIIGFTLAIVAIVFGTMSIKSTRRGLAIAGIVVACIALLLSMAAFIYAYNDYNKKNSNLDSNAAVATKDDKPDKVNSANPGSTSYSLPCFSFDVGEELIARPEPSVNECVVEYEGKTSKDVYIVVFESQGSLNKSNLPTVSKAFIKEFFAVAYPGTTITDEKAGTFAGKSAYIFDVLSSSGKMKGKAAFVLSSDYSKFDYSVVIHLASEGLSADLNKIEKNWEWKKL